MLADAYEWKRKNLFSIMSRLDYMMFNLFLQHSKSKFAAASPLNPKSLYSTILKRKFFTEKMKLSSIKNIKNHKFNKKKRKFH